MNVNTTNRGDTNGIAIRAENLTKRYRLGVIGSTTLKADLQTRWAKIRGREDPNSIIGQRDERDAAKDGKERTAEMQYINAVDDVSFTVHRGERVGIIGKNGAGKSTLLKLICRITAPTEGCIGINGRVTSMLEVGTGFHPELTGRENIYMSGAILGMTREEISARFDEIVEFSEIGRFIDTPVKRYSSGMYVRLAFAVSAHLNADIVVMDEVLAVGDLNFQEKCIRRMRQIADEENKTILYVSHNMQTVHALCDKCLVMDEGKIVYDGDPAYAEQIYRNRSGNLTERDYTGDEHHTHRDIKDGVRITSASFTNTDDMTSNEITDGRLRLSLKWRYSTGVDDLNLRVEIRDSAGNIIGSKLFKGIGGGETGDIGSGDFEINVEPLREGRYGATYVLYQVDSGGNNVTIDLVEGLDFTVICDSDGELNWHRDWWGSVKF